MSGIRKLFEKLDSDGRVVIKFEKLAKGRKKIDLRKIERKLLKPASLPKYVGKRSSKSSIKERTIKIICVDDVELSLISKYFKVNEYIEKNIGDMSLLIALLNALEEGVLYYDKKEKNLYFEDETGNRICL